MKLFHSIIVTILAFALLVAADVARVKVELTAVDKAAADLKGVVSTQKGDTKASVAIIATSATTLDSLIQTATSEAKSTTGHATDTDASALIQSLNNIAGSSSIISPKVISIKAAVTKVGALSDVAKLVNAATNDIKALGAAIIAIIPSSKKSDAQAAIDKIAGFWVKAAQAYH